MSLCIQESGSIYLQFTCSTSLQLEVIFEVLEEYDWTAFSVVTTRHHGYEDFLAMVEGMTDGSFIGWEKKSVVILNVTDDPGGARTKRLLKDNEAQVRGAKTLQFILLLSVLVMILRIVRIFNTQHFNTHSPSDIFFHT